MIGAIIGGIVIILVGVAMFPMIQEQVTLFSISNSSNVTGASASILSLVPLFFILALAMAALSIVLQGLKSIGRFGGEDEEDYDDEEKDDDEEEEDDKDDYKESIKKREHLILKKAKKIQKPQKELKEKDIIRSKYD